jgi:rhamnosyltransferase subunit B
VEGEDIIFHPVRPDVDVTDPAILKRAMHRSSGARYILREILLPALRDSYEDTLAAADGAGLIVTHPVALSSFLLARKTRFRWAAVALAPASLFSIHDPAVLSGLPLAEIYASLRPDFQRALRSTVAFLLEKDWKPFRNFENKLGLPPARNPLLWTPEAELVLGLFSPILAALQIDWPANSHATGFPFFEHGGGDPIQLQQFLDAGEPPVVFTLGSAAVGVSGDLFRQSVEAAHSPEQRAVLLVGRDPRNQPAGKLPPGIVSVLYAPHAAVFPRASVVVHQGEIGTTGEAMRAGRPMLVVPYNHDQPDHAARLKRLGVARSIPHQRFNSAIAAREIEPLLRDKAYADRPADIGVRVRAETGLANACDLLENLLRKSSPESRVLSAGRPNELTLL